MTTLMELSQNSHGTLTELSQNSQGTLTELSRNSRGNSHRNSHPFSHFLQNSHPDSHLDVNSHDKCQKRSCMIGENIKVFKLRKIK
jgi:hypothetical protein